MVFKASIFNPYREIKPRDTAFVFVAALVFEINDLFRPDERALGSLLGIGHASGKFMPDLCRQLPGSTKPFIRLKHGQPFPDTGHQYIPSLCHDL